ncbi:hypothetical protein AX15_006019 [Amanita polypyramis BW_CC]|nr:hypothetical protein AX15_006019 [Amanita polypyramis BW_CC]
MGTVEYEWKPDQNRAFSESGSLIAGGSPDDHDKQIPNFLVINFLPFDCDTAFPNFIQGPKPVQDGAVIKDYWERSIPFITASSLLNDTAGNEIYQAVIDSRKNIETNGGDDIGDVPPKPPPMCRDVLKAASTVGKYADDLNDPIARKIGALLGSLKMQLHLNEARSMKDVVLNCLFLEGVKLVYYQQRISA